MTKWNFQRLILTRRTLTLLAIFLPTIILFQNCSASHGGVSNLASENGGATLATTCVPAAQGVVNSNQQAALTVVQSKWPTPTTGSDEANAVPNIVTCVQTNGTQGCPGQINIGSPQTSNLYIKVVDGVWPEGGTAFSASDIATLRDWILGDQVTCDAIAIGSGNPSSASGGMGGSSSTTFTEVNNQIIQQYCIGCHGNVGVAPNLTTFGGVAANASACLSAIQNSVMPLNQPPLSPALQTLFANWVNGGAQNN